MINGIAVGSRASELGVWRGPLWSRRQFGYLGLQSLDRGRVIVLQALCYGAFTSLQNTSMNTLVYADIDEDKASSASSIASTAQQMSVSFGVAAAGPITAFFIPDRFRANPTEMILGLHQAFLVLGGFTILSAVLFRKLKSDDGASVSHQKDLHLG